MTGQGNLQNLRGPSFDGAKEPSMRRKSESRNGIPCYDYPRTGSDWECR